MPRAGLGAGGTAEKGLAWMSVEREFWIYPRSSRWSFCGDIKAMKLPQSHGHGDIPLLAEAGVVWKAFPAASGAGAIHVLQTRKRRHEVTLLSLPLLLKSGLPVGS